MNEDIKKELENIMMFDQYNSINKQLNIIGKCNKLLANDKFVQDYTEILDNCFKHRDLKIIDLSIIILVMQRNIIPLFETVLNLYHDIAPLDMKYILYGLLFNYITKYHSYFIEEKLTEFRIEYNNVFELIMTSSKKFKVKNKIFARFFSWAFCCTAMPKTKESEPSK